MKKIFLTLLLITGCSIVRAQQVQDTISVDAKQRVEEAANKLITDSYNLLKASKNPKSNEVHHDLTNAIEALKTAILETYDVEKEPKVEKQLSTSADVKVTSDSLLLAQTIKQVADLKQEFNQKNADLQKRKKESQDLAAHIQETQSWITNAEHFFVDLVEKCLNTASPSDLQKKRALEAAANLPDKYTCKKKLLDIYSKKEEVQPTREAVPAEEATQTGEIEPRNDGEQ